MTTKQILFSVFILGTINNIGLAIESHPNAKRFDKGWSTYLNNPQCSNHGCNHKYYGFLKKPHNARRHSTQENCDFFASISYTDCNLNDNVNIIEITHDNKEIKKGTVKELKKLNFQSSSTGDIFVEFYDLWGPIHRNNAFFDSKEQTIFYGNTLEENQSTKKGLLFIQKQITLTVKQFLQLTDKFNKCSYEDTKTPDYKNLINQIKTTRLKLDVLKDIYMKL